MTQKPVFDASMQEHTKAVTGRVVELSEHSSFISEQSQVKHNKSVRSNNMTPNRGGKTEKPSMIMGQSPNRNET